MADEAAGAPGEPGETFTLGVVADTHIPDRARWLHPALIPALRAAKVRAILHCGDICTPRVMAALEQVAPVIGVRGNRDWAFASSLPWERRLEYAGVPLALVHGHGTWGRYLWDKVQYIFRGYEFRRYQETWSKIEGAQVIVFGHTHRAENHWQDGRLWFNPGPACGRLHPSIGLLHFCAPGQVQGEIVPLRGMRLKRGIWIDENL
jgi:putative phosphoesterase